MKAARSEMQRLPQTEAGEWLETDGSGGYACGTLDGIRTRRYHGLLVYASAPPARRVVAVNGFEAWVEIASQTYALTSQRYLADTVYPDGAGRITRFSGEPWPSWTYRLDDGTEVRYELAVSRDLGATVMRWRLSDGGKPARLILRPLLSVRNHHALHRANEDFDFAFTRAPSAVRWRPYSALAPITAMSNGRYEHAPLWYYDFLYTEERDRGYECSEDLASPGVFIFDLESSPAVLAFRAEKGDGHALLDAPNALETVQSAFESERVRRLGFATPLDRAADAYLVTRGEGMTIIAGYPWFTDWGRDTFISLRGLCLATGRIETACDVVRTWVRTLDEGMVPNHFPDDTQGPAYNAVDASLWFIIVAHEVMEAARIAELADIASLERSVAATIESILCHYEAGTRYGIHMDEDGLLFCGAPGSQLTWMDASANGKPVTPRCGKPVEIQCLWLNALKIGGAFSSRWTLCYETGSRSFLDRFWNEDAGCLYDVVDSPQPQAGPDASIRPNQIFAVGGLPYPQVQGAKAKRIVDLVEEKLLAPIGLRSLSPEDANYCPRYGGNPQERDGAYHQGTVWPWLMGPFVEAWLRVRNFSPVACKEAEERYLGPLCDHMGNGGLGHVSELGDAEAPFTPRGCPFQAWSLGEFLRVWAMLRAREESRVKP